MSKRKSVSATLSLTIDTSNAAFHPGFDERAYELARILREVADKIANGETKGACRDINGNSVGTFLLS